MYVDDNHIHLHHNRPADVAGNSGETDNRPADVAGNLPRGW